MRYDAQGNVTQMVDANGHATELAYSSAGDLLRVVDALGRESTLGYDGLGRVTSMTTSAGESWSLAYAGALVAQAEGPGGWRQSYEYDANGNLLQQERTCDGVTTYTYNESDKPIATRWPGGYESTLSYNVQNQLSVYTTVTGGEIRHRYHPMGEVAEIEQADGTVKRYAYNGVGRTTESVDPAGIVTPYEYDALARVTAMNCAHRPRAPDRGTSRATWPTRGDPFRKTVTILLQLSRDLGTLGCTLSRTV